MTEEGTPETRNGRTLGEMSHTNPFTGEAFGDTQTYERGRTIAADGGEADRSSASPNERDGSDEDEDGTDAKGESDRREEVLREVDHTPPEGAESANAVHQRGGEAEAVADEDDV
jgi:hypothetical protein